MGWVQRNSRRYYYRSRRVSGRVVCEYVGTGAVAEVAARIDALAGAQRAARVQARDALTHSIDAVERALAPFYALVETVVSVVFTLEGYHMSRKNWRKKRDFAPAVAAAEPAPAPVPVPLPEPTGPDGVPLPGPELVARARVGDVPAAHAVRARALGPGPLETLAGDVCAVAVSHIIGRMVGTDTGARNAVQGRMDAIRAELVGPGATVFERLVADRVVAMWLQLHKMEGECAFADDANVRAQQPALNAAQRRYFGAIDELMKVRAHFAAPR